MKHFLFTALVVSLCSSCSTLERQPVSSTDAQLSKSAALFRTPAQDSENGFFAKAMAIEYGNKYCAEFRQTKTQGAGKDALEAETRVYKTICTDPEAMFAPVLAFSGKARYASHLLFLGEAVIQLENLNQDESYAPVLIALRDQLLTRINEALINGSPRSRFEDYAIKEGLATPDTFRKYWRDLTAQVTVVGEAIRHSELGSNPCFSRLSSANSWPTLTAKQLDCMKRDHQFEKSFDFVCAKDRGDLSGPYKSYLDYLRKFGEARMELQKATTDADRIRISRKMEYIRQDWVIEGYKTEGDAHYGVLDTIRSRCQ
jgi:hypothetical protein